MMAAVGAPVAVVGAAGLVGGGEPVAAGLADGVAAALVLVLRGYVADRLVEADGVVVAAGRSSSAARTCGSVVSRCGFSALTWPHSVSIQAWSVGVWGRPKCWPILRSAMNALVSPDRISGPLSDTGDQDRDVGFVEVDIVGGVEASLQLRDQGAGGH